MLADLDRKFLKQLRGVSFGNTSRDTGVSNSPCSARQSQQNAVSPKAELNVFQIQDARRHGSGRDDGAWRVDNRFRIP